MKKILIVRFSSIGDLVLISPVIRCLKNRFPDAKIDLLTKKSFASLYQFNPYLNNVYSIEHSVLERKKDLIQENYDLMVDLHNNLRSHRLSSFLKTKVVRFKKENIKKWRLVNLKTATTIKHTVQRYLECVEGFDVVYDGKGLDFFEDPSASMPDTTIPENFAVFVMGGKFKTKCLPEEKLSELLSLTKHPLVLIGGEEDAATGNKLAKQHKHVVSLCGKLNFHQSALIVKKAEKVLCHDTGFMHIAAAYNKPMAVIWGNTTPDLGFSPFLPEHSKLTIPYFQVEGLSCRPCSKLGYEKCPKRHFSCMQNQNIKEIADWLNP